MRRSAAKLHKAGTLMMLHLEHIGAAHKRGTKRHSKSDNDPSCRFIVTDYGLEQHLKLILRRAAGCSATHSRAFEGGGGSLSGVTSMLPVLAYFHSLLTGFSEPCPGN
jgi:hypothetical protein